MGACSRDGKYVLVIAEVISPVISRGRLPLRWHFIMEKGRRTEQRWMNDLD